MSIWVYEDQAHNPLRVWVGCPRCVFCREMLDTLRETHEDEERLRLQSCRVCGWWNVEQASDLTRSGSPDRAYWERYVFTHGAAASLRNLNLNDLSTPLEEVRAYLAAQPESRFVVNPRLFEETVASVFRDLGWFTRVTAYSGDGGIDVILDGPAGELTGVQVRRYRGAIEVAQLRELLGALVVGGYTRGIFVTTSRFQSGAKKFSRKASQRGIPIELVDADAFYEALHVAQRIAYAPDDADAILSGVKLEEIDISEVASGSYR